MNLRRRMSSMRTWRHRSINTKRRMILTSAMKRKIIVQRRSDHPRLLRSEDPHLNATVQVPGKGAQETETLRRTLMMNFQLGDLDAHHLVPRKLLVEAPHQTDVVDRQEGLFRIPENRLPLRSQKVLKP
jgi:hypothetical protein